MDPEPEPIRPNSTFEHEGTAHNTTAKGWWWPSQPVGDDLPVGEWHWPGDGCENTAPGS